jgi:hypothetical protein
VKESGERTHFIQCWPPMLMKIPVASEMTRGEHCGSELGFHAAAMESRSDMAGRNLYMMYSSAEMSCNLPDSTAIGACTANREGATYLLLLQLLTPLGAVRIMIRNNIELQIFHLRNSD